MNSLVRWFQEKRGRRLCHYCPDTWLTWFSENSNCMFCWKCNATYVYDWKVKRFPDAHFRSQGDPDSLRSVQLYFHNTRGKERKECILVHNLIDKQTQIIMDFGKWTFANPTFIFPLMKEKITPFNIQEKIKTVLAFA